MLFGFEWLDCYVEEVCVIGIGSLVGGSGADFELDGIGLSQNGEMWEGPFIYDSFRQLVTGRDCVKRCVASAHLLADSTVRGCCWDHSDDAAPSLGKRSDAGCPCQNPRARHLFAGWDEDSGTSKKTNAASSAKDP